MTFSLIIFTSSTYELHYAPAGLHTVTAVEQMRGASEGADPTAHREETLATQHAALCEEYARMKKRGDRKGMKDLLPKLQKANHARFGVV